MSIKHLYKQQLEDFQMDVASIVIVHLALTALSEGKRHKLRQARQMGASFIDLAEALSIDSRHYVTPDDYRVAARYADEDAYFRLVDGHLGYGWEQVVEGCNDWREVMVAMFPKHPVSKPVPRPEPAPATIADLDISILNVQDQINRAIAHYTVKEDGTVVSNFKAGRVYMSPEGYPLDGTDPVWLEVGVIDQMGVTAEEDDPSWSPGLTEPDDDSYLPDEPPLCICLPEPEPSDCGAPIVHHASKQGCSECPCLVRDCLACREGRHAEGAA